MLKLCEISGLMLKRKEVPECFCGYTKPEKCRACKAIDAQGKRKIQLNRDELARISFQGCDEYWNDADKGKSKYSLPEYIFRAILANEANIIEFVE